MPTPITAQEKTAVYRFYDADDRLLYVGMTNDTGVRWQAHAELKSWWPDVARATTEWFPTRLEARDAEVAAIKAEAPLYNVNGSPWYVPPPPEPGVPIRDLKANFSEHVKCAASGKIVFITKNGKRVAALIPVEGMELLDALDRRPDLKAEVARLRGEAD